MIAIILALLAIYLEESGVPMPVPSEISIAFLGHGVAARPLLLVGLWIGLTLWIVAGSTNLFTAARWLGPRFLHGRLGVALHLTPDRVDRAARWFRRFGPLAIAIARFVPGLRWAMAVACGTLGVSYRAYWLSSAAAAAVWTGLLLTVGLTVGDTVGHLFATYPWIVLLLPIPALTVIAVTATRLLSRPTAAVFPAAARPAPRVTFFSPEVFNKR